MLFCTKTSSRAGPKLPKKGEREREIKAGTFWGDGFLLVYLFGGTGFLYVFFAGVFF